jgi:hypothetical protein
VQDGTHRIGCGFAVERALARDHLVQHGSEGKQIAAPICRVATHLGLARIWPRNDGVEQMRVAGKAVAGARFSKCSSFHELWNLVDSCLAQIKGVRELYIYDTALRLGAHLRLKPERVYFTRRDTDRG